MDGSRRGHCRSHLTFAGDLVTRRVGRTSEWDGIDMKRFVATRFVAIAGCGLSLSACSSMPSWMQFDLPRAAPAATTMQFESEPAGAEARTSTGQSCRTPCSIAVTASEFSVTFTMPGRAPQTVPVKVVAPESADPNAPADSQAPRLVPNPVFVELQPATPPPARKKPAPAKKKPATRPAPTAMAPAEPPPAPAPAPAAPWPPPQR